MLTLRHARRALAEYLAFRDVKLHKSRLPGAQARLYTDYLERSRASYRGAGGPRDRDLRPAVADFETKGFARFWTEENRLLAASMFDELRRDEQAGAKIWDEDHRYHQDVYRRFPQIEGLFRGSLGAFLEAAFGAHFKIYYGVLYKSERIADAPAGSQLWHYDGGPGTCVNVMFYLRDVVAEDGAMQCVPWSVALRVYRQEMREIAGRIEEAIERRGPLSRQELRSLRCEYLASKIEEGFADRVEQPVGPAGTVLAFRNNSLHRGGFPEPGHSRYVCIFHCYPSLEPARYERYRDLGIPKRSSYPADPAEDF
jgi:hypothetical protein